jgi:hypothetical protein
MSTLPRQLWVNGPMASAEDKKIDHCEPSPKSVAQHKATESITLMILCVHLTAKRYFCKEMEGFTDYAAPIEKSECCLISTNQHVLCSHGVRKGIGLRGMAVII